MFVENIDVGNSRVPSGTICYPFPSRLYQSRTYTPDKSLFICHCQLLILGFLSRSTYVQTRFTQKTTIIPGNMLSATGQAPCMHSCPSTKMPSLPRRDYDGSCTICKKPDSGEQPVPIVIACLQKTDQRRLISRAVRYGIFVENRSIPAVNPCR